MKNKKLKVSDFGKNPGKQLAHVELADMTPLPPPYDKFEEPKWKELPDKFKEERECTLDDTSVLSFPKPKTPEEEKELVDKFVSGLQKLFEKENNWPFLQMLMLSLENCAKCQTCVDACPIYTESGKNEIYRPTYRSEIWRRLVKKYVQKKPFAKFTDGDIDLNWTTISRLMELSYRCTICRRCAQTCPIGVDNALITHELRKVFSQELGIAAKEIHEKGSMLQLQVGSSTGMNDEVVKDNIDFIDEDMEDMTGVPVKTPWDVKGADVLLIHNAGEIIAWPENPGAFALILNAAGISWTLSSESCAFDGINYGLWYDDTQLAKVAIKHAQAAKNLGVKKIVVGECGHAHKALTVIADRVLVGDLNVPRESAMAILEDIVMNDKIKLDPSRNDFPVTLHDPCNMVRLMGIVEPQRRILRKICPQFREMTPHGVENYCCGGGSGFAIMSQNNFDNWRISLSGRKKFRQIISAFQDCPGPETPKYLCAPCSNCKGQIRDIFQYYDAKTHMNLIYSGLVELIVNAMVDVKPGFISWDDEM